MFFFRGSAVFPTWTSEILHRRIHHGFDTRNPVGDARFDWFDCTSLSVFEDVPWNYMEVVVVWKILAGLCLVMSKWAARMTIFPTKWRAKGRNWLGVVRTNQLGFFTLKIGEISCENLTNFLTNFWGLEPPPIQKESGWFQGMES